ncbi:MAG: transporter [Bacilli bacterium]|nr:transporter [Bacilli bacterium]
METKMTTQQKFLIFSLFFLTFVLGTSEYAIVGLLPDIASSFGISIATAGSLVSGFAIVFAIGTPILTSFFSRYNKYPLILTLSVLFIIGNVVSALSDFYSILFISRIVTGVMTGSLITAALTVCTSDHIPGTKKGKAVTITIAGFTVASVIGLPIGTFIGQMFGWHMTFWVTSLLGAVSFIVLSMAIPKDIGGVKSSLKSQARLFVNPRILLAFLIPALSTGATFTIYTYIIPILNKIASVPMRDVSFVLFAYGIVSVISNLLGGKIAAYNGIGKLRFIFLLQAFILASLWVTSSSTIGAIISILLMGLLVLIQVSSAHVYFLDLADKHIPEAKDLAASLTPVSINVGITLGAFLGGIVETNFGLVHVSWVGALLAVMASIVTFISFAQNRKAAQLG